MTPHPAFAAPDFAKLLAAIADGTCNAAIACDWLDEHGAPGMIDYLRWYAGEPLPLADGPALAIVAEASKRLTGDVKRAEEVATFGIHEYNDGGTAFWYVYPALWTAALYPRSGERHLTPDRARLHLKRRVLHRFADLTIERACHIPQALIMKAPLDENPAMQALLEEAGIPWRQGQQNVGRVETLPARDGIDVRYRVTPEQAFLPNEESLPHSTRWRNWRRNPVLFDTGPIIRDPFTFIIRPTL